MKMRTFFSFLLLLGFIGGSYLLLTGAKTQPGLSIADLHQRTLEADRFKSVDEVADYLKTHQPDYQIIDVRSPFEFQTYSLPQARNIPYKKLLKESTLEKLASSNKKIIFYSNGTSLANTAWLICQAKGLEKAYVMQGGVNRWTQTILFPKKPAINADYKFFALYKERLKNSEYFLKQ